jgi:hypothetical protein
MSHLSLIPLSIKHPFAKRVLKGKKTGSNEESPGSPRKEGLNEGNIRLNHFIDT